MGRIEVGADMVIEVLPGHPPRDRRRLCFRTPVHPDHRVAQRLPVRVADDHAIQLRPKGDRLHRRRTLSHALKHLRDGVVKRPRPGAGVLLRPTRLWKGNVVALISRRDQGSVYVIQRGVGPLTADVTPDDKRSRQGTTTIFSPEPERIVSNASPILSSGNLCVTTAASSSRRRPRYSIVSRYCRCVAP